jgi:hypothetical protein
MRVKLLTRKLPLVSRLRMSRAVTVTAMHLRDVDRDDFTFALFG